MTFSREKRGWGFVIDILFGKEGRKIFHFVSLPHFERDAIVFCTL
jgi:hypothetical protein